MERETEAEIEKQEETRGIRGRRTTAVLNESPGTEPEVRRHAKAQAPPSGRRHQ